MRFDAIDKGLRAAGLFVFCFLGMKIVIESNKISGSQLRSKNTFDAYTDNINVKHWEAIRPTGGLLFTLTAFYFRRVYEQLRIKRSNCGGRYWLARELNTLTAEQVGPKVEDLPMIQAIINGVTSKK